MKCKLYNPNSDLEAGWISWRRINDYWERNTFHPLSPDMLELALHNSWFENRCGDFPLFKIGAIHFNRAFDCIMFHNGRHRTILLSRFRDDIPFAICNTIREHAVLRDSIIGKIEKDDLIEIPDLPIRPGSQLGV